MGNESEQKQYKLCDSKGNVLGAINQDCELSLNISQNDSEFKWYDFDEPLTLTVNMTKWQYFKLRFNIWKQLLFNKSN